MAKYKMLYIKGSKSCSSCRRGENSREADFYCEGTMPTGYGDKRVPFKGYLCRDHKGMLEDDGARWSDVLPVSKEEKFKIAKMAIDEIGFGYPTVESFLASKPTIRFGAGRWGAVNYLRLFYCDMTGEVAAK